MSHGITGDESTLQLYPPGACSLPGASCLPISPHLTFPAYRSLRTTAPRPTCLWVRLRMSFESADLFGGSGGADDDLTACLVRARSYSKTNS